MAGIISFSRKDITSTIYRSLLLASTTVAYSYIFARMFGINVKSPRNLSFEELLQFGGIVVVANITIDELIKENIVPENIAIVGIM